jgi:hypothetical protein
MSTSIARHIPPLVHGILKSLRHEEREGVLGYKYLTLDVRSINDKFELPKNHDGLDTGSNPESRH